jgi:hypothetical protein
VRVQIDLDNDEVRVYLTSTQTMHQQDDVGGEIVWEQRRNHRTQLVISTNDVDGDGTAAPVIGPRPYIYKTFSTVGGNVPTEQSPVVVDSDGVAQNDVVCPVCTHPAYCELLDGNQYGGGDPVIIEGSVIDGGGDATAHFSGCWQVNITFAPVLDECAEDPSVVVSETNPLVGKCSKPVGMAVTDGVVPVETGGGHAGAPGWLYDSPVPLTETVSGSSDYRIDVVGNQILRTRTDPDPLCRYSNCPELVVNGGDQQPESPNFLQPDWSCELPTSGQHTAVQCGSTWRGDLSSAAQLVFDSTNWQIPQTVTLLARDDDVFEPELNRRGQDAYVHHFVVAQDINLEHTYYDDIEVNDVTVSVADNDPAVVIENVNTARPTEGSDNSEIKLRLASEPMYPVTVYLQSGPFFTPGEVPTCDSSYCNMQPDDEQVIFQDKDQFNTCFSSGSTVERTAEEGTVPPSFPGKGQIGDYPTRGCFEGTVDLESRWDRQDLFDAASHTQFLEYTSNRDTLTRESCRIVPCDSAEAVHTCRNDGNFITVRFYNKDGVESILPNSGYSCNSYVTFSTTNWNTWQALEVIAVNDDTDEGANRTSTMGFLYESIDWYYNSPGARLLMATNPTYRPYVDAQLADFTVDLSMFDTRFGRHINRYPRIATEDDLGLLRAIASPETCEAVDAAACAAVVLDGNEATCTDAGACTYTADPESCVATDAGVCRTRMQHEELGVLLDGNAATCTDAGACVYMAEVPVTPTDETCEVDSCDGYVQGTAGIPSTTCPSGCTLAGDGDTETCTPTVADCSTGYVAGDVATPSTTCPTGCVFTAATSGITADRSSAYHTNDASNQVCCCELDDGTATGAANPGGAEDALQVVRFEPDMYTHRGIGCSAKTVVIDDDTRGVTISRGNCEATEGRRFWFDRFRGEMTPSSCRSDGTAVGPATCTGAATDGTSTCDLDPATDGTALCPAGCTYENGSPMPMTLGLFAGEYKTLDAAVDAAGGSPDLATFGTIEGGLGDNAASAGNFKFDSLFWESDGTDVACASLHGDGWSMIDDANPEYVGMTAPVCPYTIVLDRAPLEGTTVVIHVREDLSASTYRDHELFFYEEASYRNEVSQDDCVEAKYPGSAWINSGCFIHNIPLDSNNIPVPRGSTDLDVMFTDKDWNVPRRITVIALNDDVDEPTEVRTVYHTVGPCTGNNHNTDQPCLEDHQFTGMNVTSIDVVVVDDDIADLVVICDGSYLPDGGEAQTINEEFIGSYEAAGVVTTNWTEWEGYVYERMDFHAARNQQSTWTEVEATQADCVETATGDNADQVDTAACDAVTGDALADSSACNAVMMDADDTQQACTYEVTYPGNPDCVETATGDDADQVDTTACDAVAGEALADSSACDAVMKNADDTQQACTYEVEEVNSQFGRRRRAQQRRQAQEAAPATCTGTADYVSASCSGTAADADLVCVLDETVDPPTCPEGCEFSAAHTPTCDMDAETDDTADCPQGCEFTEPIPHRVNYWYHEFERRGAYAEDGISGSGFQGRSTTRGTLDTIDAPDSCTSTLVATVSTTDTTNCVLTPTSDYGDSPGSCADTDSSVATCAYVSGTYSDTDEDGFPDQVDNADSCTSTLVATVTEIDSSNCALTSTADFGVTPGSCADTDTSVATCAYVAGQFSASGAGFQLHTDGTGGGGLRSESGSYGNGYITDPDHPDCFGDDPDVKNGKSDKCFRIDNRPWSNYDPYWDRYTSAGSPYDEDPASIRNTYDSCTPVGQPIQHRSVDDYKACTPGVDADAISPQPNRGFKGIGPAFTEPEDEFACTIHTMECKQDVVGDSRAFWGTSESVDSIDDTSQGGWVPGDPEESGYGQGTTTNNLFERPSNTDCYYGSFQVRLNSSPGTKHVQRQYLGEPILVIEEELVLVVVTPDVTPQTKFDPPSVTFSHTGGVAEGKDTYRWDEPVTIKVVPVDDEVDERAGVMIDFTSFSITQSHYGDTYWTYTNPYQVEEFVGDVYIPMTMDQLIAVNETLEDGGHGGYACEEFLTANQTCGGRNDVHTPFRHHIRTIHTKDNDFAGVTLESGASITDTLRQQPTDNVNIMTHDPISINVVEGATFGYYTIKLDTQPRKVQRQTGTNPNKPINDLGACEFDDYSDLTRPHECGSVESEEHYWVDVTVTQNMYVDLVKPLSCPGQAPWGGGSVPPTDLHDRFPYNAMEGSPINELVYNKWDMNGYLQSCGGWQRDATYRFTTEDWNIPQYVYLYAHNDKTSGGSAVDATTGLQHTFADLHHYVETEDTLDNMIRYDNFTSAAVEGFVQRNKHGGTYTFGNIHRYPFGERSQGGTGSRITGFTTYGYTDYTWLYGYVRQDYTRTGLHIAGPACGSPHMGASILDHAWYYDGYPQPGLNEDGYINPEIKTACLTPDRRWVPYDLDGTHCLPLSEPCEEFPCEDFQVCVPRYATENGGMAFPPLPVEVDVVDNDVLAIEDEVWPCKQTSLFRFPVEGFNPDSPKYQNEWLIDYNCKSGDAGGLPGYPSEFPNGDAGVPGDRMCDDNHAGPYCQQCIEAHIEEAGKCRPMTEEELAALNVEPGAVEEEEEESGR